MSCWKVGSMLIKAERGVKCCEMKERNCSSVRWQLSYTWPMSLRCETSVEKMMAARCCAISTSSGIVRLLETSASLSLRIGFLSSRACCIGKASFLSASPPDCACTCAADRCSKNSVPAILARSSESTTKSTDEPALSWLAMYCNKPRNSIDGYLRYSEPVKAASDCNHPATLTPSLFILGLDDARCCNTKTVVTNIHVSSTHTKRERD